jgi:hypothetical protein
MPASRLTCSLSAKEETQCLLMIGILSDLTGEKAKRL